MLEEHEKASKQDQEGVKKKTELLEGKNIITLELSAEDE